ncbi:hypothetical protein ACJIZ3_001771 [Penstemon smallii]|uniref:Myb-like domain-containing protein n=1 Tax=Penstemon smallii TaxID=265156 RepID=A0ABD3U859_9LAMI
MYNTPGNVSSNPTNPRKPTISYPLHHRLPPTIAGGSRGDDHERLTQQWSKQETRDLIEIRAQIEWDFNTTEMKESLWEMLANRMTEKGYTKTIDQCKCKWRNLVTKYKELESSNLDNVQQCPFFDELHAVFTARADKLQQAQLDSGTCTSMEGKNKRKNVYVHQSNEEETDTNQAAGIRIVAPKRKEKSQKITQLEKKESQSLTNDGSILVLLHNMLSNFFEQQQRIDMELKESMEKRELDRELFEQEWRQTMEKLERERLAMEKAWREREEQRRLREESRAEKRDALLTALLNKLIHDEKNP